jgi:hypothetical protein
VSFIGCSCRSYPGGALRVLEEPASQDVIALKLGPWELGVGLGFRP